MDPLITLYRQAVFIRQIEVALAEAADQGLVPGLLHLCCGAELVEASICGRLNSAIDQVTGSHRSHGLALAMGVDPVAVTAEIMGLSKGLSGGRGGTQHLIAPENGFLCSNGIVGAQVPLAAGAALSAKTLQTGGIGVCFFGDGAANQGAVFEALNLAVALQLPLLFVLENNGIGQATSSQDASGGVDLFARAAGFGLKTVKMNGYDAADCVQVAADMVAYVRASGQPAFIEANVPRLSGHYYSAEDTGPAGEGQTQDPLAVLAALLPTGIAESIRAESLQRVSAVMVAALETSGAGA